MRAQESSQMGLMLYKRDLKELSYPFHHVSIQMEDSPYEPSGPHQTSNMLAFELSTSRTGRDKFLLFINYAYKLYFECDRSI